MRSIFVRALCFARLSPVHRSPSPRAWWTRNVVVATLFCALLPQAWAQDYPTRPIRLIVPFAPGGAADLVARAVAPALSKRLGQQVVVENKPGAGATLGADFVAKAPADGYTMLYGTPGVQMTNQYLMAKMPYDPDKDLVPVSELAIVPSALVVNKNVPAKSVQELIDYAKANPGKISFSSSGVGASSHLAGELLKQTAKIDIVHVPYKGSGAALQDLLSGQVQMTIDSINVYLPHIRAGTLRALGVSMPERSPMLPDAPPISDVLQGFDASPINYVAVRAGTPKAIIDRLSTEINAVLRTPEVKSALEATGVMPRGSTPAEMADIVKSESAKWKRVIEASGARID